MCQRCGASYLSRRPEALQEFGWLIAVNRTLIELTLDGTTPIKGAVSALGDSLVKVRVVCPRHFF